MRWLFELGLIFNCNTAALFARWVVFICFHLFYVAFIEEPSEITFLSLSQLKSCVFNNMVSFADFNLLFF